MIGKKLRVLLPFRFTSLERQIVPIGRETTLKKLAVETVDMFYLIMDKGMLPRELLFNIFRIWKV